MSAQAESEVMTKMFISFLEENGIEVPDFLKKIDRYVENMDPEERDPEFREKMEKNVNSCIEVAGGNKNLAFLKAVVSEGQALSIPMFVQRGVNIDSQAPCGNTVNSIKHYARSIRNNHQ